MQTLFSASFALVQIQNWIAGDRTLTLKQLDNLFLSAEALLVWADDITQAQAPQVRRILDGFDAAYDQIVSEVA